MKKKYLLSLILLIPFNVQAASMSVSCNKTTTEPSSTVSCTVAIADTEVSGGEGSVSVTNGTIKNVAKNRCGYGSATIDKFACVDDVAPSSMSLVTYTIEVGGEGTTTFTVNNGKVVGAGFETFSAGSKSATISVVKPEVKEEVKVENNTPTIIAARPEENKVAVEDNKEETPAEEVTEEPIEEEEVLEEEHGLKKFSIFGKEYIPAESEDHTYTIDVETNETTVDFKYQTFNPNDKVTINQKQIKDGFNKLVITLSYNDVVEEYTVYLYKKPVVEQESNFIKYLLSFVCGFLLGIAICLIIKATRKKNKQTQDVNKPSLQKEEEINLSEIIN